MIDAILTNSILPRVSEFVLTRLIDGQGIQKLVVDVAEGDFTYQAS